MNKMVSGVVNVKFLSLKSQEIHKSVLLSKSWRGGVNVLDGSVM